MQQNGLVKTKKQDQYFTNMKITIKHYERTYSIDLGHDEVVFDEFMETIKDLSKALWSEKLVNEYWE